MWLRSGVAVAVVYAGGCSFDLSSTKSLLGNNTRGAPEQRLDMAGQGFPVVAQG